ncbi:hypothetical protein FB446DRAFT_633391 [Lentinula raphanica]|nr:hypothetical protein FB446DRAFT_633391 [Lentinula raphanica]
MSASTTPRSSTSKDPPSGKRKRAEQDVDGEDDLRPAKKSRWQRPDTPPPPPKKRRKRVTNSHARRRKKRQTEKPDALHATVSADRREHLTQNAEILDTVLDTKGMLKSTAGYLGRERISKEIRDLRLTYSLDELVGPDSDNIYSLYFRGPSFFNDVNDRIFATRIPPPQGDETFPEAASQAAKVLELYRPFFFDKDNPPKGHRRGDFPVAPMGISYGGGQQGAKRIHHSPRELYGLEQIRHMPCFNRLATHASNAFAMWSPNLYQLYADYMKQLVDMVPNLVFNWKDSIFACCTLNFGPQTTTIPHLDLKNYMYGWCAVTALGDFDFRKGGHLVLWDLGVVVEFPPGWTMLIPSAYLYHSNTEIGPGETRYSITQYTAGGLFRLVDDKGVPRINMTKREVKASKKLQRERRTQALNRYITVDQLLDMK